ncbi:MAG: hypothetical protein WCX69_03815 [Candidatus Paceibacterota bacterium]
MGQATSTSEYFGIFDGWEKNVFWIIIPLFFGVIFNLFKKIWNDYLINKPKIIICEVGIERLNYPFPESYYIKYINKHYYISREEISKKIADNTYQEKVQESSQAIPNINVDFGNEVMTNSTSIVKNKIEINFSKEDLKKILKMFFLKENTRICLYDILKQKLKSRKNIEIILESGDKSNEISKISFDKLDSDDFECPDEHIKIINRSK